MRNLALVSLLFTAACGGHLPPTTTPTPPPQPVPIEVQTTVWADGLAVREGTASLRTLDDRASACEFVAGGRLKCPVDQTWLVDFKVNLRIDVDGYLPAFVHFELGKNSDGRASGLIQQLDDIGLTKIPEEKKRWTKSQLMDFQGDLMLFDPWFALDCSTGVDPRANIRCNGAGAGLRQGWTWVPMLYRYIPEGRQRAIASMKAQGWTHVTVHVVCDGGDGYSGMYPQDCATYGTEVATWTREVIAAGLIPKCAGVSPTAAPAPGFDMALCPLALTDWDNSDQADCRIDAIGRAFPSSTLLYYELPTRHPDRGDTFNPRPDDCSVVAPTPDNGGGWIRSVQRRWPNFVGVLHEPDPDWALQPDGLSKAQRYYELANPFWRDVQQQNFESDTYNKFHRGGSFEAYRAYNDAIMQRVPWLRGCSGCSPHAPPPDEVPTESDRPLAGDEIPMHEIRWVGGPNVGTFGQTSTLTRLELRLTGVFVDFTKKNGGDRWPDNTTPGWDGPLQYSLCLVLRVNGQWIGSCPIEYWHTLEVSGGETGGIQEPGQIPNNWYYDRNRWPGLYGYQPQPGEAVGVMVVAGDPRNDYTPVQERTNVVVVPMPAPGVPSAFSWR